MLATEYSRKADDYARHWAPVVALAPSNLSYRPEVLFAVARRPL